MVKGLAGVQVNSKALAKAQAKAKQVAAAKRKAAAAKKKAAAVEPHMEDLEVDQDEKDEHMEGAGQVQKIARDEAIQTSKILGWLKYRADPLKNKSGKQLDEAQQSLQDTICLCCCFCFVS